MQHQGNVQMIFLPIPILQCPECAPNMGPGLNLAEVSVRPHPTLFHPLPTPLLQNMAPLLGES